MTESTRQAQLVLAVLRGDLLALDDALSGLSRYELVDLHDVLGAVRSMLKASWREREHAQTAGVLAHGTENQLEPVACRRDADETHRGPVCPT